MSFKEALAWILDKGAKAVFGVILFYIAEYWPAYKRLPAKWKRLILLGICLVTPVIITTIGCLFGYWSWSFEESYWDGIQTGFLIFVSATAAHTTKLNDRN